MTKQNQYKIIPAIDIKNGYCVRLLQGDYQKEKIYKHDPIKIAKKWDIPGIEFIHVVDLDGAKQGFPINLKIIENIVNSVNAKIEVGGGIRTEQDIEKLLKIGVHRVILGTRICENPEQTAVFVKNFGAEKIIAGVDSKHGKAATHGWTKNSKIEAHELIAKFANAGIKRIIYTDILTDGMLCGPNIEAIKNLSQQFPLIKFISSGGISSLQDIKNLFSKSPNNVEAVIIGKALYEEKFSIEQALQIIEQI